MKGKKQPVVEMISGRDVAKAYSEKWRCDRWDDEASDEECNDVMDQNGDQYEADDMEQEAVCTGTITGES